MCIGGLAMAHSNALLEAKSTNFSRPLVKAERSNHEDAEAQSFFPARFGIRTLQWINEALKAIRQCLYEAICCVVFNV